MPDFTLKQNFPIQSVIDAAQRKAQLEQQSREHGNEQLLKGLQSIGQIGQSLVDKKLKVARSLALGKQLGIPDDQSRLMEHDDILKLGAIKNGQGNLAQYMLTLHPELASDPAFIAAMAAQGQANAPTTAAPAAAPAAPPATPAAVHPSSMPPAMLGGGLPPGTTQQASSPPVPIPMPPLNLNQPVTKGTANMIRMGLANQPGNAYQYTPGEGLKLVGQKGKNDQIITTQPPKEQNISDPTYQSKLEKEYTALKARALSSRSGGLGLENMKVDQAIHLRQSINQRYDAKTGTYNIPPSLHAEYVIGLARLMSPGGIVAVQTMEELRQKTAREGVANTLISMGFNPEEVGGTTQSVARFFVHQIDRQGEVAEDNRQGYMDYIHGQAPVDLDPRRIEAHDRKGLNSFKSLLSKSPDFIQQQQASSGGGGLSADEAAEMQALEAKLKSKGKL